MLVRQYRPGKDHAYAEMLFKSRSMNPDEEISNLPQLGLIAFEDNIPVGMAFLRMVEGNLCLIDAAVTNAEVSGAIRHKAMDWISTKLIKWAKLGKLKGVLAYIEDENTIARALSKGGYIIPHKILSLKL